MDFLVSLLIILSMVVFLIRLSIYFVETQYRFTHGYLHKECGYISQWSFNTSPGCKGCGEFNAKFVECYYRYTFWTCRLIVRTKEHQTMKTNE